MSKSVMADPDLEFDTCLSNSLRLLPCDIVGRIRDLVCAGRAQNLLFVHKKPSSFLGDRAAARVFCDVDDGSRDVVYRLASQIKGCRCLARGPVSVFGRHGRCVQVDFDCRSPLTVFVNELVQARVVLKGGVCMFGRLDSLDDASPSLTSSAQKTLRQKPDD